MAGYPQLLHTVLDTTDVRGLAEFYRELLGLRYRPGDEPPADGTPDDADWLVLVDDRGARKLAFQQTDSLPRSTWPAPGVPMQLHLDLTVPDVGELERQRERALALGAELRLDRTDDPGEPLYAFADLAGHPFCIFVA
jgi:catechol 2,3-dioxygenase-like lactoylglutathione lyase family enzyme